MHEEQSRRASLSNQAWRRQTRALQRMKAGAMEERITPVLSHDADARRPTQFFLRSTTCMVRRQIKKLLLRTSEQTCAIAATLGESERAHRLLVHLNLCELQRIMNTTTTAIGLTCSSSSDIMRMTPLLSPTARYLPHGEYASAETLVCQQLHMMSSNTGQPDITLRDEHHVLEVGRGESLDRPALFADNHLLIRLRLIDHVTYGAYQCSTRCDAHARD